MIINIQPDYDAHIRDNWRKFAGFTEKIFIFRRNKDYLYGIISRMTINYLRKKLKKLDQRVMK